MCLSFFGILLLSLLYKVLLIIMQLCKFLSLFKIKPTTLTTNSEKQHLSARMPQVYFI